MRLIPDFLPKALPIMEAIVQQKELKHSDLKDDQAYFGNLRDSDIIFYPNRAEIWGKPIDNFQSVNTPSGVNKILRLATTEERQWLDACIAAGKFVPPPKQITLEEGKWYEFTWQGKYPVLGKIHSSYNPNSFITSLGVWLDDNQKRTSDGYTFDMVSEISLANMEEVYKWFPEERQACCDGEKYSGRRLLYRGGKWAEIISKPIENLTEKPKYYECLTDSYGAFTRGKIYKIKNPDVLNSPGNFIDDKGSANGWVGNNHENFKPSTREAYEAQEFDAKLKELNGALICGTGSSTGLSASTIPEGKYELKIPAPADFFADSWYKKHMDLLYGIPKIDPHKEEVFTWNIMDRSRPEKTQIKTQPFSKILVKSHEEFKIKVNKQKSIKL